MVKYRLFTYKKIIVLSDQNMEELRSLLLKHCDKINYQVITKNEAEITFDSFDELMSFNNFGDDKIVSLSIKGYVNNEYRFIVGIDFSPQSPYDSETIRCQYFLSDIDKESVLTSDLHRFLEKVTKYDAQYKGCKIVNFMLFCVIGIYPVFIPTIRNFIRETQYKQMIIFAVLFISQFIMRGLYNLCTKYIWRKLYPRVTFAWGEGKTQFQNVEKLRSNLFWGVLIAALVSLGVGVLQYILFKQ